MIGLLPLLKKEMLEQLRTYRLLIVGVIFLFFVKTTPLTLKYLPEIIELAGGAGMEITIPPPTAEQSLLEYAGTVGQIGVLLAVLMAMGSIANERKNGTAIITLSKPVSRAAFVNAKLLASTVTFLVSLLMASIFCYGYTVWLIEDTDVVAFIGLNFLIALFLVFCLSVTLLFSSMFKSSLAAGGISLGLLIGQAGLSAIPRIGDFFPGKLLTWGNLLLMGGDEKYWASLAVTLILIIICLYFAQRILNTRDI
jgi:ABC-2 type transport system permease protein